MVTYDYVCSQCGPQPARVVHYDQRDEQTCHHCGFPLRRLMAAPMGRMKGEYGKGGGPDRFTADMLGTTVKDLPPALKADYKG